MDGSQFNRIISIGVMNSISSRSEIAEIPMRYASVFIDFKKIRVSGAEKFST